MLSCEFCEIFKNTFFTENLWRTASIIIWILTGIYIVIVSINAANIRLDEDVLKTSFVFVFRRRLQKTASRRLDQDGYIHLTHTSSEDVFKTSSRRLDQDQYIRLGHTSSRRLAKTYSKRLQDVFKTSCKNVFKTSSRHLCKTFWRRLQNVFKTSCKNAFKTSLRRRAKMSSTPLQDISSS